MKIQMHRIPLQQVPVDLFADPDGTWSYESLVSAAGFDPESVPPPLVAALSEPWFGHPEGAAVVTGADESAPYVVVVELEDAPAVRAA